VAGLGSIALGGAPIFGGALLAIMAGQFKGPNFREQLKQDMDLLDRLPADAPQRAELQRSINEHIDDLVAAADRSRSLREAATSYEGNWRDIVLFLCVLMFTIIWWDVKHSRSNWLVMFILLIVASVVTALYALRGILRAATRLVHRRRRADPNA
jgi:hypothetical protein